MYRVKFMAYCGMLTRDEPCETEQQARFVVSKILKSRRKTYPCTVLEKGKSWEVMERDDAMMVSDRCGTLHLDHIQYECRDCGCLHETRAEALVCCFEDEPMEEEE